MKALLISSTLALLTLLAPAQDGEPKAAAAAQLLDTMKVREQMAVGFHAAMGPSLQPMIEQMGLNEAQVAELNTIFTAWWEEDIDQEAVIAKFTELYTETFTLEELRELDAFYQTPLGQKVLHTMPELTQKGMQIGMEAAQNEQEALKKRMQAFQEKVMEDQADAEDAAGDE
ncbi:DUF2059 domain-containing protein [Roseibacillus ishigakijimensis]|uniref:DUF2059 domain-containing protein n=1 Tax=Roseibacillus ishigakijimensis TaxID=454146 RepID=A0A934RNP5_9BACT|nr:DUF2059 domain-containing protein [Roseibacillus ishigakijimensis]MBK1834734.1 DUF2059 domain-containing protein [Roseibacillus ishigakijimensis]